jgi:hypothetical protein
MTVTEAPETTDQDASSTGFPVIPGNAGHPLDKGRLPYWLDRPCPPWCMMTVSHQDGELYDDRLHMSAGYEIELTLEEPHTVEAGGKVIASGPAHLSAGMWQHYRERDPHICLIVNDGEDVLLELAEAQEMARLLSGPPEGWAPVTLTMMDPDAVMPPGYGTAGEAAPVGAHHAAFPFTRPAVLAVRQVLDTVTVFTQVRRGEDQVPRYLAFTPAEAAELAAALASLLGDAR